MKAQEGVYMKKNPSPEKVPSLQPIGNREQTVESGVPVVGIGASAGGLEAFRLLLAALPADAGLAVVLIQHLDPTHDSSLKAILGRFHAVRQSPAVLA
jgi:two-component system, chemotaxis family, CheB/CheR fusion protein